MMRQQPRSTQSRSSAASDVYKRQRQRTTSKMLNVATFVLKKILPLKTRQFLKSQIKICTVEIQRVVSVTGITKLFKRMQKMDKPALLTNRLLKQKVFVATPIILFL